MNLVEGRIDEFGVQGVLKHSGHFACKAGYTVRPCQQIYCGSLKNPSSHRPMSSRNRFVGECHQLSAAHKSKLRTDLYSRSRSDVELIVGISLKLVLSGGNWETGTTFLCVAHLPSGAGKTGGKLQI